MSKESTQPEGRLYTIEDMRQIYLATICNERGFDNILNTIPLSASQTASPVSKDVEELAKEVIGNVLYSITKNGRLLMDTWQCDEVAEFIIADLKKENLLAGYAAHLTGITKIGANDVIDTDM